jgi:predicted HTH transcriptional regulator
VVVKFRFHASGPDNGREVLLRGYITFGAFETWFDELAGRKLTQQQPSLDLAHVYEFIAKKGKVAARELSVVFDTDTAEVEGFIDDLVASGVLHKHKAGSGFLYSTFAPGSVCDPVTGVC